jgi:dihydroflavonol-4-reductase
MVETVLVTGGSGFIAGWCIVELLQRGYEVRTTVRNLSKEPAVRAALAPVARAGNRVTFFAADLTKDEGWDGAVSGCDFVLHVASPLGRGATRDPNALISVFKFHSLFIPQLRMFTSELGRRNDLTSEKARRELGFAPRPATETVIECALSLLERTLRGAERSA